MSKKQTFTIILEEVRHDNGKVDMNVIMQTDPPVHMSRIKNPDTTLLRIGLATVNGLNAMLGRFSDSTDTQIHTCNKDGSGSSVVQFKDEALTPGEALQKAKDVREASGEGEGEASSPSDTEPPQKRF